MKTFSALMYSHAPCAVTARERVCASVRLSFCESNALLLKACRFFFFSHLKLLASVSNRRNKSNGAVRMVTHAGSFRNIFNTVIAEKIAILVHEATVLKQPNGFPLHNVVRWHKQSQAHTFCDPFLISLMVSVHVKHHVLLLIAE